MKGNRNQMDLLTRTCDRISGWQVFSFFRLESECCGSSCKRSHQSLYYKYYLQFPVLLSMTSELSYWSTSTSFQIYFCSNQLYNRNYCSYHSNHSQVYIIVENMEKTFILLHEITNNRLYHWRFSLPLSCPIFFLLPVSFVVVICEEFYLHFDLWLLFPVEIEIAIYWKRNKHINFCILFIICNFMLFSQ